MTDRSKTDSAGFTLGGFKETLHWATSVKREGRPTYRVKFLQTIVTLSLLFKTSRMR